MIDLLTISAFFVLGFLTGVSTLTAVVVFVARRSLKKTEKSVARKDQMAQRMKRIKEISDIQLEIAGQVEMPQRNALDGKHKNGLMAQMKALDEEKITILKSMLADGFNPEIATMDSAGVVTRTNLSDYLASLGHVVPKDKPATEKVGKFTVYRGGRDDGNNTTH